MDALLASIAAKKAPLDAVRPLSQAALRHLQKHCDIELTYTSNAIVDGLPAWVGSPASPTIQPLELFANLLVAHGEPGVFSSLRGCSRDMLTLGEPAVTP